LDSRFNFRGSGKQGTCFQICLKQLRKALEIQGAISDFNLFWTAVGDDDDSHINALMCGFGVGLSWGVVTAKIEKKDILPMIYTNEFFQDGGVEND
jgi:hypothetical protein